MNRSPSNSSARQNSFHPFHPLTVLRLSALVILILPTLACSLFAPRPTVEWDPAADNTVIQASISGGMVLEPNPMPVARLWGDGRLIWAESDAGGARHVRVATLTPGQMRQLLQTFVDDGFFGWQDNYSPGVVYDAGSTCLTVSLASVSKSVCETVSGAPASFHDLFDLLAGGAGATGADFVPDRGYLRVTPLGTAPQTGGPVVAWPAEQLKLRLADVGQGQWIDGDALRLAWGAVNANPLAPILRDGDDAYQAQLYVENVMGRPPS
jgi:hypothetical protein